MLRYFSSTMFLSRVTFGLAPTDVDSTQVDDAIVGYLISLQKNGQICGDFLHSLVTHDVNVAPRFWRFPFRCVDCRLVSQMADDNFEPKWAHMGERR